MRKVSLVVLTVFLATLCGGIKLFADEDAQKFAWIDLEKVIQGYYKTEPLLAKLEKEKEKKEDEVKKLVEEIKMMEGKMALMTESGRRKQEKEILKKRMAASTMIQEAERDLLVESAEMEKVIIEEVRKRAAELAEKGGYTFIFLGNTIIYKDPALDLTDKLLEVLNKEKDD